MILEILLKGVTGEPLVVDATMVLVRLGDTNPVLVVGDEALALRQGDIAAAAGDFGPDGVVRASHALDPDFNATLRAFGVNRQVICDQLVLPQPPPGAKIIRAPK